MNHVLPSLKCVMLSSLFFPCCLLAQAQASLEENLTRAKVLHHAGAYGQSRLLYENALHRVDRDWQRDLLNYNIGSSLIAEGQPQAALDLWAHTTWAPSPSPWLARRLSWNWAVAKIEQAKYVSTEGPESHLEQIRLLHAALKMFGRAEKAECMWHEALSSDPCLSTLSLQEAIEWTNRRLFALQTTFHTMWRDQASALDLAGAILAAMQRFEESSSQIDCNLVLLQIKSYWNSLEQFPSLNNTLHPAMMAYQTACLIPVNREGLQEARKSFQQLALRFHDPLYLNKEHRTIRLLYAQGLAEGGNLLLAFDAARQQRSFLKGSQEGQWAQQCARFGEEAFKRADFDAARLLWQLTCFWMDEQATLLEHSPSLDDIAKRLLNRHLWTQFFTTHLAFFSEEDQNPALKEALTQLIQSTLSTAASIFSLARDMQLRAFESNQCSSVAWDEALPLINHGETSMQAALKLIQSAPFNSSNQIILTSSIQHAYPFWVEGVNALKKKPKSQSQEVQEIPPPSSTSSSSEKSFSSPQRTLLLQEMEAEDCLDNPPATPPPLERPVHGKVVLSHPFPFLYGFGGYGTSSAC